MPRQYVRVKAASMDEFPDGENYLARTVFESHELIDIGLSTRTATRSWHMR